MARAASLYGAPDRFYGTETPRSGSWCGPLGAGGGHPDGRFKDFEVEG